MLILKVMLKNGKEISFSNVIYTEARGDYLVFIANSGYEQTITLSETMYTQIQSTEEKIWKPKK